jgi:hypothetical protein
LSPATTSTRGDLSTAPRDDTNRAFNGYKEGRGGFSLPDLHVRGPTQGGEGVIYMCGGRRKEGREWCHLHVRGHLMRRHYYHGAVLEARLVTQRGRAAGWKR